MRLFDWICGVARAEIHAVLPETMLNVCAQREIPLWGAERTDGCTLRFSLYERDIPELERIAAQCQAEFEVLERHGGRKGRRRLQERMGLLLSLALGAALLFWSSFYIWEIDVHGCRSLTKGEVLRALADCGVTEGSYWPSVSNETLRAEMLLRLPKLAWMTLSVSGSRAVVVVEERTEKPVIYTESSAADIVASHSGVVRKLLVRNGLPLVQPGQLVLENETLVTGTRESLSRQTRYIRADAEIQADTWYEWNAVEPAVTEEKGAAERTIRRFALRFGKKRINLFGKSRKDLDGYDKIVHEYNVGVKGLFRLPVSLIREEYRLFARTAVTPGDSGAGERLKTALSERIDGEIVQASCRVGIKDGFAYTSLRAQCRENIAQTAEKAPP